MANNYEQIMALVNAGNKMGLSNTITRDNGIPLDLSSVYSSYDDAVIYAATKAIAYHGQPVAVITATDATLYVITPVSQGKVTIGETEYDIYLKQVGAKTLGDEKSIVLSDDGILSLAGFAAAAGATLPQKQADGTIKWVSIDAIVEGDGNTKTVVASGDSQLIVTPTHDEESDTYTYTLGLNVDFSNYLTKVQVEEAIATALQAAKDYADENDANTVYDDTALAGRVSAIEEDYLKAADKYDDAALAGRVSAIEGVVGDTEDGLVKAVADNKAAIDAEAERALAAEAKALADAKEHAEGYADARIAGLTVAIEQKENVEYIVIKDENGAEIASANASRFVQDSFLDDVSYDSTTGKISFTWSMGDGSTKTDEIDVGDLVDTYTAGTGLSLENNQFAVDTAVIATVEALNGVKATAEAAQTAQQVSDAIDAKIVAQNLGQYAVKSDVETALADKVNTADYNADKETFALKADVEATYAKIDAVNTTLVDYAKSADVANIYATKDALAAGLAAKVDNGSIAHTSEGVAEGVTVEGTAIKIVVDSYTKEETREYVAGVIEDMTGGESAADVLLALNNYKESNDARVAIIEGEQTAQNASIVANAEAAAAAKTAADNAQASADAAAKAVTDLAAGQVATNKSDIAAIVGRLGTVEAASGTNTTNIGLLTGRVATLEGANTAVSESIGTINSQIAALANEDARLAGVLDTKANAAEVYTKTEANEAIKTAIDAIPAVDLAPYAKTEDVNAALALKANAADVYTKTEADAAFMSEAEVDARINALIVAADPEGGKTITDIQNLVKYVDENAGEIASLVTATEANTSKLVGINTTVTAYVDAKVASVVAPKASAEVTVAEDGTLGIGEVNVNKLVQTAGDVLILNGGTSSDTI